MQRIIVDFNDRSFPAFPARTSLRHLAPDERDARAGISLTSTSLQLLCIPERAAGLMSLRSFNKTGIELDLGRIAVLASIEALSSVRAACHVDFGASLSLAER